MATDKLILHIYKLNKSSLSVTTRFNLCDFNLPENVSSP